MLGDCWTCERSQRECKDRSAETPLPVSVPDIVLLPELLSLTPLPFPACVLRVKYEVAGRVSRLSPACLARPRPKVIWSGDRGWLLDESVSTAFGDENIT